MPQESKLAASIQRLLRESVRPRPAMVSPPLKDPLQTSEPSTVYNVAELLLSDYDTLQGIRQSLVVCPRHLQIDRSVHSVLMSQYEDLLKRCSTALQKPPLLLNRRETMPGYLEFQKDLQKLIRYVHVFNATPVQPRSSNTEKTAKQTDDYSDRL